MPRNSFFIPVPYRPKYVPNSGPALAPLTLQPQHDEDDHYFIADEISFNKKPVYVVSSRKNTAWRQVVEKQDVLDWVSPRTYEDFEYEQACKREEEDLRLEEEEAAERQLLLQLKQQKKLEKKRKQKRLAATVSSSSNRIQVILPSFPAKRNIGGEKVIQSIEVDMANTPRSMEDGAVAPGEKRKPSSKRKRDSTRSTIAVIKPPAKAQKTAVSPAPILPIRPPSSKSASSAMSSSSILPPARPSFSKSSRIIPGSTPSSAKSTRIVPGSTPSSAKSTRIIPGSVPSSAKTRAPSSKQDGSPKKDGYQQPTLSTPLKRRYRLDTDTSDNDVFTTPDEYKRIVPPQANGAGESSDEEDESQDDEAEAQARVNGESAEEADTDSEAHDDDDDDEPFDPYRNGVAPLMVARKTSMPRSRLGSLIISMKRAVTPDKHAFQDIDPTKSEMSKLLAAELRREDRRRARGRYHRCGKDCEYENRKRTHQRIRDLGAQFFPDRNETGRYLWYIKDDTWLVGQGHCYQVYFTDGTHYWVKAKDVCPVAIEKHRQWTLKGKPGDVGGLSEDEYREGKAESDDEEDESESEDGDPKQRGNLKQDDHEDDDEDDQDSDQEMEDRGDVEEDQQGEEEDQEDDEVSSQEDSEDEDEEEESDKASKAPSSSEVDFETIPLPLKSGGRRKMRTDDIASDDQEYTTSGSEAPSVPVEPKTRSSHRKTRSTSNAQSISTVQSVPNAQSTSNARRSSRLSPSTGPKLRTPQTASKAAPQATHARTPSDAYSVLAKAESALRAISQLRWKT